MSSELQPVINIDPDQINKARQNRNAKVTTKEKIEFLPFSGSLKHRIQAKHLGKNILKEAYKGTEGPPLATIDEEVQRVKEEFFKKVDELAETALQEAIKIGQADVAALKKKNNLSTFQQQEIINDAKRGLVANLLLSQAYTAHQIDTMYKAIRMQTELDEFAKDAFKRRVYLDVLQPLQYYRPWGRKPQPKDPNAPPPTKPNPKPATIPAYEIVENGADFTQIPLEKLREQLEKRFDLALEQTTPDGFQQGSIEKRNSASFLLVTVSYAIDPTTRKMIFPEMPERELVVLGLFSFVDAMNDLAGTIQSRSKLIESKSDVDRDGGTYLEKIGAKPLRIDNYKEKYDRWLTSLSQLVRDIKTYEEQLGESLKQREDSRKQFQKRKAEYESILSDLLKERKKSAKLALELKNLEDHLFRIQRLSAAAGERNLEMEAEIRRLEIELYQLELKEKNP